MPSFIYNGTEFTASNYEGHTPDKGDEVAREGAWNSTRGLIETYEDDTVLIFDEAKGSYAVHRYLLEQAGLEIAHEENVIFGSGHDVLEAMRKYAKAGYDLSVYRFTQEIHDIAPDKERHTTTVSANRKNEFLRLCLELGVPTPSTLIIDRGQPVDLSLAPEGPVLFKPSTSALGAGIKKADTLERKQELVAEFAGISYQIQERFERFHEQSDQYRVIYDAEKGVHVAQKLASTEQIVNGESLSHQGNKYPAKYDTRGLTQGIAQRLVDDGMRGIIGFDVLIPEDDVVLFGGSHEHIQPKALVSESNARKTGATSAIIGARKLAMSGHSDQGTPPESLSEWVALKFKSDEDRLRLHDYHDLTYDGESGAIITGYKFSRGDNEVSVLIVGSPERQKELIAKLDERLIASKTNRATYGALAIAGAR